MSVHKNDERRTYTVFSLFKLAYIALTPDQHRVINEVFKGRLFVDVQICCRSLLEVIRINELNGTFDPLRDRRLMFDRVEHGRSLNIKIFQSVVTFGHLDCLKIACEIGFPLQIVDDDLQATNMPLFVNIPIVYDRGYSLGLCASAAHHGNLTCLEYLHQNGVLLDWRTCNEAARMGNIDCLKYAMENWGQLDVPWLIETAAFSGNLISLKYLHEHGCPWSVEACAKAASKGHLDCLKYLHANGCPWNMSTCIAAIRGRSIECLKFAIKKGCPFDRSYLLYVAWNVRSSRILNFLLTEIKN